MMLGSLFEVGQVSFDEEMALLVLNLFLEPSSELEHIFGAMLGTHTEVGVSTGRVGSGLCQTRTRPEWGG